MTPGDTRRAGRRLALVAVAAFVLAACGGGGSSTPETKATEPAPVAYSAEQLKTALPSDADLPLGGTIDFTCPGKDDICDTLTTPDTFGIGADVDAASPVGAEQVRSASSPIDFVAVTARQYPTAAGAAADAEKFNDDEARYDGDYDLPEGESADGTSPRFRGTGSRQAETVGAWTGYSRTRTVVSGDSENDPGLLVAAFTVTSGRSFVVAFASLSAADREPDAAADVAEGLVRDYLERLG